jgi:hypothetical protein
MAGLVEEIFVRVFETFQDFDEGIVSPKRIPVKEMFARLQPPPLRLPTCILSERHRVQITISPP